MRRRRLGVFALVAIGTAQHFDEHAFELPAFEADGRGLDGEGARAEGLTSKPLRSSSSAIAAKSTIWAGVRSMSSGMSRRWRWTRSTVALAQDFFEEDAFVRDVLVDDPEAVFVGGEDEGLAELAEGLEGGEGVEGVGSGGRRGRGGSIGRSRRGGPGRRSGRRTVGRRAAR